MAKCPTPSILCIELTWLMTICGFNSSSWSITSIVINWWWTLRRFLLLPCLIVIDVLMLSTRTGISSLVKHHLHMVCYYTRINIFVLYIIIYAHFRVESRVSYVYCILINNAYTKLGSHHVFTGFQRPNKPYMDILGI